MENNTNRRTKYTNYKNFKHNPTKSYGAYKDDFNLNDIIDQMVAEIYTIIEQTRDNHTIIEHKYNLAANLQNAIDDELLGTAIANMKVLIGALNKLIKIRTDYSEWLSASNSSEFAELQSTIDDIAVKVENYDKFVNMTQDFILEFDKWLVQLAIISGQG